MVPAATPLVKTAAKPVRRLGFVFMPMGCDQSRWTPSGDTLDALSPILGSLAPVREHVTVISNLELQNAYPGSHATSNSAFLSAARAKLTESTDYYLGTTVDQIAAQHIGQDLPPEQAPRPTPRDADLMDRSQSGGFHEFEAVAKSKGNAFQYSAGHVALTVPDSQAGKRAARQWIRVRGSLAGQHIRRDRIQDRPLQGAQPPSK